MAELAVEKKEWLESLTGVKLAKEQYDKDRALKSKLIADMAAKLEEKKAAIKKGFTFEVKTGLIGTQSTLDEDGDMMDELDTEELANNSRAKVSGEDVTAAYRAMDELKALKDQMAKFTSKRTNPDTGEEEDVPLFSERELEDEIYTPMVRERLMPENFVPGKYSRTQRMLDATNEMYDAKLQEYSKEKSEAEDSIDKVEKAQKYFSRGADLAKKCAAVAGPDGKLAGDIITIVELTVTTSCSAYAAIRREDVVGFAEGVKGNVSGILGKVLTCVYPDQKDAITAGVSAFDSITSVGVIGAALMKRPKPDINKALDAFADGLGSAFKASGASGDTAIAGTAVVQAFKQAANAKALEEAIRAGKYDVAMDILNKAANDAVKGAVAIKGEEEKKGKSKEEQEQIDLKNAKLSEQVQAGVNAAASTLKVITIVADPKKRKNIGMMVEEICSNLGAGLAGSLKAGGVPDEVATTVAGAYGAATSPAKVAAYLCQDPPNTAKALEMMGQGIEKALATCAPKGSEAAFNTAGKAAAATFLAAAKGVDIKNAMDAGNYSQIATQISGIGDGVLNTVLAGKAEFDQEGKTEEEKKAIQLALTTAQQEVSGQVNATELARALESVQTELNDVRKAEEIGNKVMQAQIAQAEEEMPTDEEILYQLRMGEDEQDSQHVQRIEELIKTMMRDRMIMELALKLAGASMAVVAKFVPQLRAAQSAVKFIANLRQAAQRAVALNKWIGNRGDAFSDQSPYTPATRNFVHNQAAQFTHYAINAALDLANTIASACAASGAGWVAVGGEVASKALDIAQVAENLAYDLEREIEYKIAWEVTKSAFKNPKNRKLGQKARELNPTLAKYAIGYGAVVENDSIAKSALSSCGLSERHLAKESGTEGVEKVKKYLELCFPDDQIIMERVAITVEWAPAKIEVTAKCWLITCAKGVKHGHLTDTKTGAIDAGLKRAEALAAKLAGTTPLTLPELEAGLDSLDQLLAALNSYYPSYDEKHADANRPHEEMGQVRDLFVLEVNALKSRAAAKKLELETPPPTTTEESEGTEESGKKKSKKKRSTK